MPSPSPSPLPSTVPTPSPTANPLVPTLMPSPSPTDLPTTPAPTPSPSAMPSPAPSPMPSTVPTPSPTKLPTTPLPSPSPSAMPSPSPSPVPSLMPSPSPSPSPKVMPSPVPTVSPSITCPCLVVVDLEGGLSKYVGVYRYKGNSSPGFPYKWMWERSGYGTQEAIYFSNFGTSDARWVIKGSTYGEWAEITAGESEPTPPYSGSWLIKDDGGDFYHSLGVDCSQCEVTPAPTPDPTEAPTDVPTSLTPTNVPTPAPSIYCLVLNITDLMNGYYTGYFEMEPLPYNGKYKWTDPTTGESLYWSDTAMFENEGPVNNIWLLGFTEDEGEQDSHFLIYGDSADSIYPHIDSVRDWMEYTFNTFTNQNSSIVIDCEDTVRPTQFPTAYPSEPLCAALDVHTCCDPVYTDLDGMYHAVAHRGGKDMFYNSENGYSIYYTIARDSGYWSIRSEDDKLIYVENGEDNGAYPAWETDWDLENHVLSDLEVMVRIGCFSTFTPSQLPSYGPTEAPTEDPTTLDPTPMPTDHPTSAPTDSPTENPTESCVALLIEDQHGEVTKFDGTFARLADTKNGKAQWFNYDSGGDVYWIDRGVWANTWIIRANDGDYLMSSEVDSGALHPPLMQEWASLGDDIIHGEHYQNLIITCTTQPPAPSPTASPTLAPTCEGNSIHIEDPCNSEYSGYYNRDYTHDGKNAYVRVDGEYEVIYIGEELYAGMWMVRPHNAESCDEFFITEAYEDQQLPPENAFWDSYPCGCSGLDSTSECNFRITCMHTKAPIPTEHPTSSPTASPISTDFPTSHPTPEPSPMPTREDSSMPTASPTNDPTLRPTTPSPTQAPVPYDCTPVDLQPCSNVTGRDVTFYERSENQGQVTSNYYETKLYTEQKGYTFVASQDMVMNEAGMAFINLANYQSITVRVFNDSGMMYESDYSYGGNGITETTGTPRGDYYTFKNLDIQLISGQG